MSIGLFSGLVKILGGSDGTTIGNVADRLKVDVDGQELVTIDDINDHIRAGKVYTHIDVHEIANGGIYYHMVVTPNSALQPQFTYSISATAECQIFLYEEPTVSANGSETSNYNHNRNNSTANAVLIYHQPTVSSAGTMLEELKIGGTGGNKQGSNLASDRWILKSNTKYLIKVISNASANKVTHTITLDNQEYT